MLLMEVYLSLFFISFIAASLLPAYSEVMLAGLLVAGHDPLTLWCWATAGNTLGACLNWALGRFLLRYQEHRYFPFKHDSLAGAQKWFQKYGVWSLLMAWAPIGGDALTFVAGIMRVRFIIFFILTAIGKGARYAILVGLLNLF